MEAVRGGGLQYAAPSDDGAAGPIVNTSSLGQADGSSSPVHRRSTGGKHETVAVGKGVSKKEGKSAFGDNVRENGRQARRVLQQKRGKC